MARTIAERLSEAATRSFVGRDDELSVLRQATQHGQPPFAVAFVHGPGGIGKSRLMHTALKEATPPVRVAPIDCGRVEPTPRGFLSALGERVGTDMPDVGVAADRLGGRYVIALDRYESFGLLDTWLRQTFLPVMPETVVTVIAGREPPSPAWHTTPGWEGLFQEIRLQSLGDDEATAMLTGRGLDDEQAERVNRFARGHPLALELAAAAVRAQPDLEISSGPPPQVLQELTRAFLDGLPPEAADTVRAASVLRRVTAPALEAVLDAPGSGAFEVLRDLPFTSMTEEGLELHDLVRDTISRDLAGSDPAYHRRCRQRAWRFLSEETKTTAGLNLWQQTADLLFLVQNPAVRGAFFPAGGSDVTVAPASTAQIARVIEIAHSTEPRESAELLERWCLAMPQAVNVVTDPAGGVAAAYVLLEVIDAPADLLAADPVTASWADHLRRSPVAEGERVLFLRRWLDRDTGELLTPALGACWLDVKRTYMELRPDLRRLYTTVRHPDAYPYQALKLVPLPGEPAVMLGADYLTLMIDFGPNSVDGWLCGLVGFELGVDDDDRRGTLPEGTVTILFTDIVGSTALTERVGDAAFRSMAREVERSLRQAVGETGGTVVEGTLLGDGLMAVFTSAGQAVSCGLRGAACGGETGLELRVGLHAGDVIRDGNNVFGGAVNIAARVASAAAPGEVLVSDTVRSLARTSAGVQFEDRGAHEMKGVADAQRLHAVVVVREASTV